MVNSSTKSSGNDSLNDNQYNTKYKVGNLIFPSRLHYSIVEMIDANLSLLYLPLPPDFLSPSIFYYPLILGVEKFHHIPNRVDEEKFNYVLDRVKELTKNMIMIMKI